MPIDVLAGFDFSAWTESDPGLEPRNFLEEWLRYQRHEFLRKLRDLEPDQLAAWAIHPVELSVLGLVRHMTEMEHIWLSWGLGGGEQTLRYGDDDYAGGYPETVDEDLRWYFEEVERAEGAVAAVSSLDSKGAGHHRSLRATLVKMIDEYAIHAWQAHMLRFAALGEMIR
jgi:uncharacterized damage-inducible protein DinB